MHFFLYNKETLLEATSHSVCYRLPSPVGQIWNFPLQAHYYAHVALHCEQYL